MLSTLTLRLPAEQRLALRMRAKAVKKTEVALVLELIGREINEEPNADERTAWLALSERNLMQTWDNTADDVFNELLSK